MPALPDPGHRHRYPRREAGNRVRSLRAGRRFDGAAVRRHGAGAEYFAAAGGHDGGTIWLESKPGEGSTFHFTAPFRVEPGAAPAVPPPVELNGRSVLVIDGDAANRRILEGLLSAWHMTTVTAANVQGALRILRNSTGKGQPFSFVIADSALAEWDGSALRSELGKHSCTSRAKVILLFAANRPGDISGWRDLATADCLMKPVGASELLERMRRAIGPDESRVEPAARVSDGAYHGRTAVANPAGRGQPGQPAGCVETAGEAGTYRHGRRHRARSGGPCAARSFRSRVHGCADAGDGRIRSYGRHPCDR